MPRLHSHFCDGCARVFLRGADGLCRVCNIYHMSGSNLGERVRLGSCPICAVRSWDLWAQERSDQHLAALLMAAITELRGSSVADPPKKACRCFGCRTGV